MRTYATSRPFFVAATVIFVAGFTASCGTTSSMQRASAKGYLRFVIEPEHAEVSIDEEYSGLVSGWMAETVPVEPGTRKVTLMADGYLTQRFDIEVAPGELVTLELNMERVLGLEPVETDRASTFHGALRER